MNIPAIIMFAACAAISGYAGRLFLHGRRSSSWPSVQGTITTSRIDMVSASGSGRSSLSPVFVLQYAYVVDGQEHSGTRVAMAPTGWFSIGRPAELQKKCPEGKEVTVFYDHANPAFCTLMNGVPEKLWSFYAIAAMFAIIGLMLVLRFLLT